MYIKKSWTIFLMIALLAMPITSLKGSYFDSWVSWIQAPSVSSVSNLVDKDTASKLFPFVIIAALIYWVYKQGGQSKKSKPIEPIESFQESPEQTVLTKQQPVIEQLPYAGKEKDKGISWVYNDPIPRLEQLAVYGQFNTDGGGGASCGYHSLLRPMQIIRAIYEDEQLAQLKATLMNNSAIALYFGNPDSVWRKHIIEKRKKAALKNLLHMKFVSALESEQDPKQQGLYKSALGRLEDWIVQYVNDWQDENILIDFSDNAIKEYIRKGLGKLVGAENQEHIQDLSKTEIMKNNIDFDKMRQEIFAKNSVFNIKNLMEELNKNSDLRSDLNGEWLDDGEVELLWNYENEQINSLIPATYPQCGFKAIADFQYVGSKDEFFKHFDEVMPYIKEKIAPYLNEKQELFQSFSLGTMRQSGDQYGSRGHWYGLVMHQNKQGKRRYYITDSAGTDRTHDLNALKIINLIEDSVKQ